MVFVVVNPELPIVVETVQDQQDPRLKIDCSSFIVAMVDCGLIVG